MRLPVSERGSCLCQRPAWSSLITFTAYCEQAAYGVPVRMALISLLLGLHAGEAFASFEGGFEKSSLVLYDQPLTTGLRCANPNCIVQEEKEAPYVRNKFHLLTHDKAA